MKRQALGNPLQLVRAYRTIKRYRQLLQGAENWELVVEQARAVKRPHSQPSRQKSVEWLQSVRTAGRYQKDVTNTCLVFSLAAHQLLQEADVDVKVCIGIAKYPVFHSHAWIECEGVPIGEDDEKIRLLTKIVEV